MKYEIDFLPVGESKKGGDAICFRYIETDTDLQFVGLIDGGISETGTKIINHIKEYYGTDTIDVIINTHPHADHTNGLLTVIEQMKVKLLMMHKPWDHSEYIEHLVKDQRITSSSLKQRVKDALHKADDLSTLAESKNIRIIEPFAGTSVPSSPYIKFIGPTEQYYRDLLKEFASTPDLVEERAALSNLSLGVKKILQWLAENWDGETLAEPTEGTNAENNSSVITLLEFGDDRLLLTGDAGVPALEAACDYADAAGIALRGLKFFQIPHHGSKRNVGPSILNRILGEKRNTITNEYTVLASVPKEGEPKHPSKRVINAIIRRGGKVILTQGNTVCYHSGMPNRNGWVPTQPLQFQNLVEAE